MPIRKSAETAAELHETLKGYAKAHNLVLEGEGADGPATVLRDLLTDVLHYCRTHGIDFEDRLAGARACFRAEMQNEAGWASMADSPTP